MNRQVNKSRWYAWALLLAPVALVPACGGDDDKSEPGIDGGGPDGGGIDGGDKNDGGGTDAQVEGDGSVPQTGNVWVYTSNNKLLQLSAAGAVVRTVDATPPAGEVVWGVDVRPANGKVYALTSAGSIYTLDTTSGAFAEKQALVQDTADATEPFTALDGTAFAVDFNPVVDKLRIVSNTGQNLRVDVTNGKVSTDTTTAETSGLSAGAYTNSWPQGSAPCGTTLYIIDSASSALLLQAPPNDGVLSPIGALTGVGKAIHAFDIVTGAKGENVGLIAATESAGEVVYQLDLVSGKATVLGTVSGQGTLVGVFGTTPAAKPAGKMGELVATTASNKVVTFERGTPGTYCTETAIDGLAEGEQIVGGDVRPADGNLWVLTRQAPQNDAKLRRLSIINGTLTSELALSAASGDDSPYTTLTGNNFGVGFNPVSDLLRVTSDTGLNLHVDSAGKVTTDTSFDTTDYAITEVAYTNPTGSVPATSTTLYAIDSNGDRTARIGGDPAGVGDESPNSGKVTVLAPLAFGQAIASLNINGSAIEPVSGVALAALSVGTDDNAVPKPTTAASLNTQLYLVNPAGPLTSDPVATSFGKIGTGADGVTSLSFSPKP